MNSVHASQLIKLRGIWKEQIKDLNGGRNWSVNDDACREARASKARAIQECIVELNYVLKHGQV